MITMAPHSEDNLTPVPGLEGRAATYPDRLRLPIQFDPNRLAVDLAALAHLEWTMHFVRDNYEGDWSVLPLRAPAGATHPILRIAAHSHIEDWVDTEFLEQSPYFQAVLAQFPCRMGAARLMRLRPGSAIREHSDPDLSAEDGVVRLHIPILTNPAVDFRVNGRRVDMRPGECWYLRLADPHGVRNDGESDRIHLVFDCRFGAPLEDLFASAAAAVSG